MLGMKNDYVLYADDDEDDQQFFRLSFNNLITDILLECVSDGNQVLDFLKDHTDERGLPCLIILDRNMPLLNGDDVVKELKSNSKYKDVPLVLFSTSTIFPHVANKYKIHTEQKPTDINGWKTIVRKFFPL
jgi:CheY-like chemotaxis protein